MDDPCKPKEKAEDAPEERKEVKLETCPWDPRFPNQNQTKHCFVEFVDYQRCTRLLGDYDGCNHFKKCYTSMCPKSWIEHWQQQLEDGTFPMKIYPPIPKDCD